MTRELGSGLFLIIVSHICVHIHHYVSDLLLLQYNSLLAKSTGYELHYTTMFLSRANYTREFLSVVVVQWTVVSSATCLHMVEESIIRTLLTGTWNSLRILVHTMVCGALVAGVCNHEVAIIFHSPVCWTIDFGWDHDYCDSCSNVAESTWNIVVFNTGE